MQTTGSYEKKCEKCKESYTVRTWSDDGTDWYGHRRGSYTSGNDDEGCPSCGFSEKKENQIKLEAQEFIDNNKTIFNSNEEIFDYLLAYYKKFGGEIRIASYGMYLNISKGKDWNEFYPSLTRAFFDYVDTKQLKLIVGMPYFNECHEGCEHCKQKYEAVLERFKDTQEKLNLNIRYHDKSHLKLYNIGDLYIAGGINLSISGFADAAFIIDSQEQKEALDELFNGVWRESKERL